METPDELRRELSASEAIYGFCGWLTTQEAVTIMSARHDCGVIADRIRMFCDHNNLKDLQRHWDNSFTHPRIEPCKRKRRKIARRKRRAKHKV